MKKIGINIFFKFLVLLILFSIYTLFAICNYVSAVSADISSSVLRLHVLANSDSTEDQNLKYKVRDAILSYMNTIISSQTTKEDAIQIASCNLKHFNKIASDIVASEGYNYNINVTLGKYDFPTKNYGDIVLPSGTYDSLRIEIGKAEGHNWWCVMFPPLCFVDVTSGIVPDESKEDLKEELSSEEYDLITSKNNSTSITFKFKLVELFENIKISLTNNKN